MKVVSWVKKWQGQSPLCCCSLAATSSRMLAARSGFDWEGSLLRASEEAGVRRRLSMSDFWNLKRVWRCEGV